MKILKKNDSNEFPMNIELKERGITLTFNFLPSGAVSSVLIEYNPPRNLGEFMNINALFEAPKTIVNNNGNEGECPNCSSVLRVILNCPGAPKGMKHKLECPKCGYARYF